MEKMEDAEKRIREIKKEVNEIIYLLERAEKEKEAPEKKKIETTALYKAKKLIPDIQMYKDHLETTIEGAKRFKAKISTAKEEDTVKAQKNFLEKYIPFMEKKLVELIHIQKKLTQKERIKKYVMELKLSKM